MIVDTDTGSDDAVALIMALRAPDVTVRAITVVAGNVPLLQGSLLTELSAGKRPFAATLQAELGTALATPAVEPSA